MKFQYYEIRPCVDFGDHTQSYLGEPQPHPRDPSTLIHTAEEALKEANSHGHQVFWTLYGRDEEGLAHAIGDFATYERAYEVLSAILMPLRDAINLIESATDAANGINEAITILEDICNQSTNEERL